MHRGLLLASVGVTGYFAYRLLKPQYDFADKHVLVTGGSRGLGLVLARELAARGARLSICSRTPEQVARAHDDLIGRGAAVFAQRCDVTDPDDLRRFIAAARREQGPIDVLVNNAGVIQVGPLDGMRETDFEQSLRTHFWAAYHAIQDVVPEMKARGAGRIVNVASVGGKVAVPHLLPYSVGKFALVGYSNGIRGELKQHGIVVTTVCPGLMRTGSHLNAEFKGRNEDEYAWFALLNGLPGLSVSAEAAARKIVAACACGDAEVVIGLPAKFAVAAQALFPNLAAGAMALANRWVLPEPGGTGTATTSGAESRGKLPELATALTDRAAAANNEE